MKVSATTEDTNTDTKLGGIGNRKEDRNITQEEVGDL